MKQLILRICFLLLISSQAISQQTHFIYLQTENREPFYVMLNKKNYSSSSIGYMIIPKLENGEYNIRLGFAKSAGAEQDYVLQVKDNEQGYLIKDFGDKGWALFNLQSLNLQYAGQISKQRVSLAAAQQAEAKQKADIAAESDAAKRKAEALAAAGAKEKADAAETKKKADEMALANAKENTDANTTADLKRKAEEAAALKQQEASMATEAKKKADELAALEAKQKAAEAETAKLAAEKNSIQKEVPAAIAKIIPPVVTAIKEDIISPQLIAQIKTDAGIIYKYAVTNADGNDTVNVFISGAAETIITSSVEGKPKDPITPETNTTKEPVKFLNMDFKQDSAKEDKTLIEPVFNKTNTLVVKDVVENKKMDSLIIATETPTVTIPKWDSNVRFDSTAKQTLSGLIPNSNCKAQADEKDFFVLRKKMAAEEGTDEMVLLAKKTMKEKCFTTTQVRNLSVLFLNDADRYQFLDAVYPFTYDAYQYDKLLDLLNDKYYVERFKGMIRK